MTAPRRWLPRHLEISTCSDSFCELEGNLDRIAFMAKGHSRIPECILKSSLWLRMKWSALQRMGGPTVDEAKRFPMGAHHDAYSRKIRIFAGCTPQENAREEQFEWLFLVWVLCLIFYFTVLPISRLTAMLDGTSAGMSLKFPYFFREWCSPAKDSVRGWWRCMHVAPCYSGHEVVSPKCHFAHKCSSPHACSSGDAAFRLEQRVALGTDRHGPVF